jgi:ABC-type sugar transport system substrate-binding protein
MYDIGSRLGSVGADVVLNDAGKATNVAVANDKALAPLVAIADGFTSEIRRYAPASKVQTVEVSLSGTPGANAAATVTFLQRNPDVKYLVYTTPSLMPGAYAALRAAGLTGRIKICRNISELPWRYFCVEEG